MFDDPRYEVRSSTVHGMGLFSKLPFSPGMLLGMYTGRIINEKMDGPHVLWLEDDEGRSFGIEGDGPLSYLNHSSTPNAVAGVNSPYVFCTFPINVGDEIFISYGDDWVDSDA